MTVTLRLVECTLEVILVAALTLDVICRRIYVFGYLHL